MLNRILPILVTIPVTLLLASCGGGDNQLSQLEELDAAMVQLHAKEHADEAAVARAEASGASAATIALLESTVAADQAELNVIVQRIEQESNVYLLCLPAQDQDGNTTTRCTVITNSGMPMQL